MLQPYRDLAKLLRKGSAVSNQTSWVFRGAPFQRCRYRPVIRSVEWLADVIRLLQSGAVNLYLLHVSAVILLAYLIAPGLPDQCLLTLIAALGNPRYWA